MPGPLPRELDRVVRTASVAPYLRASFDRLPAPIRLDVRLPTDPEQVPLAARQLLKLALLEGPVRLGRVVRSDRRPCQATLTLEARRCVLCAEDLGHDLPSVVERLLGALLEPADVAALLQSFALQSSCLSTLRSIVARMLACTDVDEAHYLMLAGITSGYGLGFNRAALLSYDAEAALFRGVKAIGPFDQAEAHRIWEEIELEGMTIERLISDFETRRFDTRLQQLVQRLELCPTGLPEDEVALALGPTPPLRFERVRPINPGLGALGAARQFLLAAIRPHGRLLGLLFADDVYAPAPIDHERMLLTRLFLDQAALVWESQALLGRVAELARQDELTGLCNRREFQARLDRERSRCCRSGASLSLLYVDVDHFKHTNDTAGHEAGDAQLRSLGAVLRHELREHDVAARWGGDEFVLLLPDCDGEHLAAVARRVGGRALDQGISVSLGGAMWPGDCEDPAQLLAVADRRLYRAKDAGRGCAVVGDAAPLAL
jgi:diguanylate cyclase (GGDEF)-like protein